MDSIDETLDCTVFETHFLDPTLNQRSPVFRLPILDAVTQPLPVPLNPDLVLPGLPFSHPVDEFQVRLARFVSLPPRIVVVLPDRVFKDALKGVGEGRFRVVVVGHHRQGALGQFGHGIHDGFGFPFLLLLLLLFHLIFLLVLLLLERARHVGV